MQSALLTTLAAFIALVPLAPFAPFVLSASFVPSAPSAPLTVDGSNRAAPYWTDFRGPARDGRYAERAILTDWPATGPSELWRRPIGKGWSSVVVANGHAFTIEQRRKQEVVVAYDVRTGDEVWAHGWNGDYSRMELLGGDGPRATPTWHDGMIYALGAEGELHCLRADRGTPVWRRNILTDSETDNLSWAMAASPLIVDDLLIVLPGGRDNRSVVAYDRHTGERKWAALGDKQAYTAPMVATLAGRRQLLIVSAERAAGLALDTGRLLWSYPWKTSHGINVAQPLLLGDDRVFLSAGYGHGAAVFRVRATHDDGDGDSGSNRDGDDDDGDDDRDGDGDGDGYKVEPVWTTLRMKNKFTSSVLHEGHIYGLDEGILACLDVETGGLKWKGGRYGHGQLLLASGQLVIVSDDGELALVKASPEGYRERARVKALEGKTWNHPALADGILFLRNARQMAAFDLRVPAP